MHIPDDEKDPRLPLAEGTLDRLYEAIDGQRRCCRFFGVDNITYKGIYLPGVEEFVAHGYKREDYERFLTSWKKSIDETGHP